MAEYIKRSDALKVIETANIMVSGLLEATMKLCVTMDRIAAADVVPVRNGRWRKAVGTSGVVRMACTNCGFMRFPENDSREPMFAYCPRCGALMDKDGDGE